MIEVGKIEYIIVMRWSRYVAPWNLLYHVNVELLCDVFVARYSPESAKALNVYNV